MMYRVVGLANGVQLALAPLPHMASVSVGFWVAVGGRCEPEDRSGICHFLEHMVFKGTRRRTAGEISAAVEGVGGYLNAFTSEEHTCYHAKAGHEHFGQLLDVLWDMLLGSRFAAADIETERGVIKEEIGMYLDQPQQYVQELLNAITWPGHPLGRPLTGTEASVDRLRRSDLVAFHRQRYVGPALVVAVAGRYCERRVIAAVGRVAERFRLGERAQFAPAVWRQDQPRVRCVARPTEQTQIALGIRTCSRQDDRRFALRLLNVLAGENMSSRLFQELRERAGLTYSVYSALSFFEDAGDLVISAGLEPENLPRVLALTVRELRRLKRELPGRAEFRRTRDYVLGQIDLSLESTENQMLTLGEQVVGVGRAFSPGAIKRRLAAITPAQVRAAARDFFRPERLNLAVVTPRRREAASRLRAELARLGD